MPHIRVEHWGTGIPLSANENTEVKKRSGILLNHIDGHVFYGPLGGLACVRLLAGSLGLQLVVLIWLL